MRAPGMAWRRVPVFAWAATVGSWLMLVIGPVLLAALTMLMIDRNYDGIFFADGSGGAPLLWQHLSWIFYTGAYMLILIFAFGAIAEIVPAFSRKPLFNRAAVMASLAAIAVIGTLAWMQNMLTAPIGIGWMYFAMLMSLALIVPFGLVIFNLIATLVGGTLRMRAPLLFAIGAISAISIGLAAEICAVAGRRRLAAEEHHRRHRRDPLRAGRRRRLRRLRRPPLLVPEDDRPDDGREPGADLLLDDRRSASLLAFVPLFFAGAEQGQVIDAYKFFDGTGVTAYNLIASIGVFVLFVGILLTLVNAILSRDERRPRPATTPGAATRSSGSRSRRRSRTTSTSCPTSAAPGRCATSARRSPIAPAAREQRGARVAAGSLSAMQSGAGAQTAPDPTAATRSAVPRSSATT